MFGVVYVRDIPKMVICILIAIVLLLLWGPALEHFFPHGGTVAAWIGVLAFAATFSFSWWAGTGIWERIDLWMYGRRLERRKKDSQV
jgi:amino acid transporter